MYRNTYSSPGSRPEAELHLDPDDLSGRLYYTAGVARMWCCRHNLPKHLVADAEQESHIAVLEAMPGYDRSRPLQPFLRIVVERRLCDWYYRKTLGVRRKRALRDNCQRYRRQHTEPEVSFKSSVTDSVDLRDAASWLKPAHKQILDLLLAGKTPEQIGKALGCTTKVVWMRQQEIVSRLRAVLKLGDEE
jgi:RNA polymerase sigma factor (sigma-70 family)